METKHQEPSLFSLRIRRSEDGSIETIAYRANEDFQANADSDAWYEFLRTLCDHVYATQPPEVVAAWQRACDAGRGPDATADQYGWRTVYDSDYDNE